jgi:hypothetical protein
LNILWRKKQDDNDEDKNWWDGTRTTDTQWSLFPLKSRTFGLGQTNWADKFSGIWGIFSKTISTHFVTVSPLSMFFIVQPLFIQKTKPLYPYSTCLIGIWIWATKNYGFSLRVSVVLGIGRTCQIEDRSALTHWGRP